MSTILTDLLGFLPSIILNVTKFMADVKDDGKIEVENLRIEIDEALETFDELTGDTGAVLIPDMPADKAELALDHLKEFLRIMLYSRIRVKGYTVEKALLPEKPKAESK